MVFVVYVFLTMNLIIMEQFVNALILVLSLIIILVLVLH